MKRCDKSLQKTIVSAMKQELAEAQGYTAVCTKWLRGRCRLYMEEQLGFIYI